MKLSYFYMKLLYLNVLLKIIKTALVGNFKLQFTLFFIETRSVAILASSANLILTRTKWKADYFLERFPKLSNSLQCFNSSQSLVKNAHRRWNRYVSKAYEIPTIWTVKDKVITHQSQAPVTFSADIFAPCNWSTSSKFTWGTQGNFSRILHNGPYIFQYHTWWSVEYKR